MPNPRISEIVTRFSGKTFSSHQDVLDWLTTTLEAFEKEVREEASENGFYSCKHCGKVVLRNSNKGWIKSYCDSTGKDTRLVKLKGNHDTTH